MKKSTLNICFALLVLAWLVTSCSLAVASPAQSTGYKMIPIEAWEQLKQNSQSLELKLTELSIQVDNLEKPSRKLQQELSEAKKQLQLSQEALTELNLQLESVKGLQERTQNSLQKLTKQIEEERNKQEAIKRRLRLQRTLAYCLLGLAVIR